MTSTHAHFIRESRHYRLIGWRDMAAEYLAKAAAERLSKSMQKEAA